MENQKVEKFEKGILFGFVRWASLLLGAVGIVAVVGGGLLFFKAWTSLKDAKAVTVKPVEVKELVEKKKAEEAKLKQQQQGQETPEQDKKPELSAKEKEIEALVKEISKIIVEGVENPLPNADDEIAGIITRSFRSKFDNNEDDNKLAVKWLNGLKDSVMIAPKNERTNYADAYINLYGEKQQKEISKAVERRSDAQMKMVITGYAVSVGLALAFLSGLVLILVAIERNTRK